MIGGCPLKAVSVVLILGWSALSDAAPQEAADEACTEAHWLDPRLTDNQKHELAAKACRDTRYTLERWQCAAGR